MFACSSFNRYINNPFMMPSMYHHCHCGNNMFSQLMQFSMMQSMMNMFFAPRQQFTMPMMQTFPMQTVFNPFQSYRMPTMPNSVFNSYPTYNNINIFGNAQVNVSGKQEKSSTTTAPKKVIKKNEIVSIACEKAKKYGVDERLVLAVIEQESGFKNGLTSCAGAKGVMQLMPSTAKSLGVTDVMDPEQNIDGGVRLLKQMLDRYNGNVVNALAAYNWGPGNVDKYLKGQKSMPKETQNYIKIADRYQNYQVA